jgi:octaprenyl-diphosphate synthase
MGKSLGDDLREGKATLPLIAAMQRGSTEQAETIKQAIETGDLSMLEQIVAIVKSSGALDVARNAARQEAQRAINAAEHLPEGPYKEALIALASQLLVRRT